MTDEKMQMTQQEVQQRMEDARQDEMTSSYRRLDEMRMIYAASRMGSWTIWLPDGKAPAMTADDQMQELLGIKGQGLTPEQTYDAWFSNIVPSSLQSVLDSVEKMEKIGRDENTYLWRHPVLGERYVRCGGTAKQVEGGFLLSGYHYDVDEFIRAEKKKDEALMQQMAIIETLSKSFRNVFVANLTEGTAWVMRLEKGYSVDAVTDVSERVFPFDDVVERWVRENVYQADKERMAKSLCCENLRRVFAEQDEYVGNYRSIEGGVMHHYQYDFRRIGSTDNIVAGFQLIDAIVEEQTAQQKRMEEQFAIIDSLSSKYVSIYLANINNGTGRVIRMMDGNGLDKVTELSETEFSIESAVKRWIALNVVDEDKEKMLQVSALDKVRHALETQDEYVGNYRSTEDGETHNYQFNIKKIDDNGNVIVGFQNIDAIIEEHEMQEEKQRALEQARMQDEREHAEVINSLSTIYSTIFRADVETHRYEILVSVPLMKKVAEKTGNFDDVKEKIIESFMMPEFRAELRAFLDLNTLADRMENVNTVMTDYKAPTGQWMQARFIVKRRDENGRVKEILYVARDITKEKNKELEQQAALTHALAAAQQANKAKTTFLNSMSHDIRTPMNAIIGFTALAQTHIEDQGQVQDYLAKISTSSTHLLSLINDILDMSRIESGTVKLDEKPVHIPDLLHDLRTMIQGLVNAKNLNLFIDTQDVVNEDVLTDKLRLNQVLLNIASNAIKFTQPGGDIMIRLMERPCSLKHYTTYEFSVKDNGIGMSKEFIGHIFDTFSREYSATVSGIQGTGLGMAITKNIVDMMGGDIQVESEEGKGSLFTVTLTLRIANEPVRYAPIPELLGARVLVVDDDINTCRSVSKMLRGIEMRPDWTTSGKEAVVRAQDAAEMKDEYNAYIIDYLMPDMNGIETVRRIRKVIREDVPIIVLTAYDWADFEHEARAAGVTAFVSKPIFMSELRAVLTRPVEGNVQQPAKRTYDYTGKRVLLVEDNELNREIATAILEETGIVIDSANDGDEAVAAVIAAPADRYDVVLMDIQMPKMDGYTATREIRTLPDNRKANIPIVAMTANAFEEDRQKAYESGMNGHIIKPISIDAIANVLDKVFAEKK